MTLRGIAELGTNRAPSRRRVVNFAVDDIAARGHVEGGDIAQILVFRDSATGEWLATTTVFPAHYRNEETR